jgi:hypothetical protein
MIASSFLTSSTPATLCALSAAMLLSATLATLPRSVTRPFATMMWIVGTISSA